jgi:ATP-binding cassette subfamily B protein/subfamily B ATP-binding cassette protein MsbA
VSGIVVLTLGSSLLQVLQPWPMKLVIDAVVMGHPLPERLQWLGALSGQTWGGLLVVLVLAVVGLFVLLRLMAMALAVTSNHVGTGLTLTLGERVFDHLQRQSQSFHREHATGDLVRRVNKDCGCIRDLMLGVYLPALTAAAPLASIVWITWQIDRVLALVALLVAIPLPLLIRYFAGPMERRLYEQQAFEGQLMAQAERTLVAVPMVQAFGQEDREQQAFAQLSDWSVGAYMRALASQLQFKASITAITTIGTAGVMLIGGYRALAGHLTVGDLYLFLSYLSALYAPLETFAYLSSGYAGAKAGGRRVFEILDHVCAVDERRDPRVLPARSGGGRAIRFCAVTVGYAPERLVLRDVSLAVAAGQVVAVVGHSGVGKSTLVSLLLRFMDPLEGRVEIDGVDVRDLRLNELRRQIAYVPQEATLLALTMAENIAYGRPGAEMERVREAAHAADVHGFIDSLPDGYDTKVGERSMTVSGGQAQRLAIARALLLDAPIVILDEPTASLDAATEHQVMEAIARLTAGRTSIIIAHRLSTVKRADRIVVLEDGHIVQTGTHEQLMAEGGAYERLYASQMGGRDLARLKQ